MSLFVISKIAELRNLIKKYKKEGKNIGLVPTMGCLHNGHKSLIEESVKKAGITIVSIFVNPVQFGPDEDFDRYPRSLEEDKKVCEAAGANIIFAPSVCEMYPDFTKFSDGNFSVKTLSNLTVVAPPYALTDMMCGKSRIGHFDGVATVVSKLFNIALPDYAFFGMKDIQQLFIIKKMVKDLDFPVKIIPCPLIREKNGLAISSRNKYLTGDEKTKALSLSKALFSIYEASKAGIRDTKKLFDSALTNLDKNVELEYLEFVDYDTFEPVTTVHRPTVCAIAAKLGSVRLIDNILIEA